MTTYQDILQLDISMDESSCVQEAYTLDDIGCNLQAFYPRQVVLDAGVQVPIHALHDEEHSWSRSTAIRIIYCDSVQSNDTIMYG